MKILVLENVNSLDDQISMYIQKEHAEDDITIIYRVHDKSDLELTEALGNCDMLLMQSTFYDVDQLRKFLSIIPKFKNIKETRIIFTYTNKGNTNKLLSYIHESVCRKEIIEFVENNRVKEILCDTFTNDKAPGQEYFSKLDMVYDIIPLFYNKKYDTVWHERKPDFYKSIEFIYKKVKKDKSVCKIENCFEKSDYAIFKDIIKETKAGLNYNIEILEEIPFPDEEDIELLAEKKIWQKILNKYFK